MNRKQSQRAVRLADRLVEAMSGWVNGDEIAHDQAWAKDMLKDAVRLRDMLKPPPTMEELLQRVPGETIKDKAKEIGISRQHWYNLVWGTSRPNLLVAKRLAELTGVDFETVKSIW